MKKYIAVAGVVSILVLGAGCSKGVSNNSNQPAGSNTTDGQVTSNPVFDDTKDIVFSDPNTKVTFHHLSYLQPTDVKSVPGAVSFTLAKRPGSTAGLIGDVLFSTKTRDASMAELDAVRIKSSGLICDSEAQLGCDKWDQNYALYKKAIQTNDYTGYYAMGASKVVINGITYVVAVTYNMNNQQYQTTYTTFTNNTRITFVDPATGGIEYGVPFNMNAKNRTMVETIAKNLANRSKIDDVQMRARTDEFFNLVSSVKIAK